MKRSSSFSTCRKFRPALDTYLDGELDAHQVVEVETHLTDCNHCQENVALDRAIRSSLQTVATYEIPVTLQQRVLAAMLAEPSPETQQNGAETPATAVPSVPYRGQDELARFSPRYAVPLVAAACFAFFFSLHKTSVLKGQNRNAMTAPSEINGNSIPTTTPSNHAAITGFDNLLEELVTQHAQPLPPEVTRADDVRTFDPFVGVPVEPPKLQGYGAKWLGGRMLSIRENRAAMLQYSLAGGHRVTVYVYDPRRVRSESRTLRERPLTNGNGMPIYVGSLRGYNVAATERRGVGYALATDLDELESVELVSGGVP